MEGLILNLGEASTENLELGKKSQHGKYCAGKQ